MAEVVWAGARDAGGRGGVGEGALAPVPGAVAFQGEPSGEGNTRSVGATRGVALRQASSVSASGPSSLTVRVLPVLVGLS